MRLPKLPQNIRIKQFSIIDVGWLDAPNLRQYVFKEHEGSYLVGVAARWQVKLAKLVLWAVWIFRLFVNLPADMLAG